ncbi:putative toxin-antitoxin system toxin component, PIN family [Moraxella caviae]|uniref:Putative toxin-antitoxin system toxin component, PIN family n=1 Tax=Moraxella caviae TaxID=34060 RepID=A0A378R566_9GAMM|nr:putative toxin-antitoxin system toxin component, PIN family [Moraxella caviae]VEW12731.1 putative toxin-antitoxin system toxin component, PIN family [Moraxella caviae]
MHHIVIDTNVIYSALISSRGASHRLIRLLSDERFCTHLSVSLLFEYEDVCKRLIGETLLTAADIDALLNYICSISQHHRIYYL